MLHLLCIYILRMFIAFHDCESLICACAHVRSGVSYIEDCISTLYMYRYSILCKTYMHVGADLSNVHV